MGFVELQPHQIVFLQCKSQRLYAEVIQTVPDRRLCWARPLVLLNQPFDDGEQFRLGSSYPLSMEPPSLGTFPVGTLPTEAITEMLVDLRQVSDLLLPLSWFQAAVDTDVIPILAQLIEPKAETPFSGEVASLTSHISRPSAQEQLQQFIRDLCKLDQHSRTHD